MGYFFQKWSILTIFGLDREISANQCWRYKGAMYNFFSLGGQHKVLRVGFGPQKFSGAKSRWFGAFFEKWSIFTIFGLDREISTDHCWRYKGAMYNFLSLGGQNKALRVGFGSPKFSGAKSGWFGAFFEKWSNLTIFGLDHEISANQCWRHKGVMYNFFGLRG